MQEETIQLKELISNDKKNVVITTHRSPDGDAMGSALAIYHLLIQLGHNVQVITPNDYPEFLHWLPANETVLNYEKNKDECDELSDKADVVFLLDFGNIYRIEPFSNTIKESTATKVLIDHHEDPDNDIADIMFSNTKSCATAELVYEVIESMKMLEYINKHIAECLYVGIMTDTGSFKYPSTTAKTHNIISKLIEAGADNAKIHDFIYDTSSASRMKLLGYCLNEKLILLPENKSAIISLTNSELQKFNFKKGDTEGVVNYALAIKDIVFAAFIVEKDGLVKLSLRSKGNFGVNKIAKKYFNGGGHINAAGGISKVSVNQTVEMLKEIIKTHTEEIIIN